MLYFMLPCREMSHLHMSSTIVVVTLINTAAAAADVTFLGIKVYISMYYQNLFATTRSHWCVISADLRGEHSYPKKGTGSNRFQIQFMML